MKVLLTATVREFFRQRAGMFFVILGILFGFLSSREHYAFAIFFLTDPNGMYYLLALWLGYAALCGHFVINLWAQPHYVFIYHCRLWPWAIRIKRFFLMALGLFQPVFYYGVYLTVIARQDNLLHKIGPVYGIQILLVMLIAAVTEWRVRHPFVYQGRTKQVVRWPFPRPVSWIYWSLEWLVRQKGVTVLICKLGAAAVLSGTLLYYGTGEYDLRLPAVCVSLGYLFNIGLSYELYLWENEVVMWNRSMPVSSRKRFVRLIFLHALIILPETAVLVRQNLLSLFEIVQLYGLGLSSLLLFHTYLYRNREQLEDLMKPVLFGYVFLTIIILYKVPLPAISLLCAGFAFYRFPQWYRDQAG